MFALITSFILFLAETKHAESGFTRLYNQYFNIPGFEAWKFINLAIFVGLMAYFLKKPLGEAFKTKRDAIRAELIKAAEEKKAALDKLTAAEGKLAQLDTEKENILKNAKDEAAHEKKRLAEHTRLEAERLKHQSEAELIRMSNQTRAELRRFSAEESIRLAEEKLRAQIDGSVDARLVKAGIQEIGGLN
ncbi:MAG TPA: hypothetical protein VHQ01_10825 [Pyrinomonadaceae bacterium]|nr:hypothetical protein [Pyrinomonadaceae bacterium]